MHAQVLLLGVAGLATTALADFFPAPTAGVVRRQDDPSACTSSAMELLTSLPTPTGELLSSLATVDTAQLTATTADCSFYSGLPESLKDDFVDYQSSLVDWFKSESSALNAFATSCADDSEVAQFTSAVNQIASVTGDSCATTETPNVAIARPTGLVAGAAAAAGFIGAVAML
ncbi:hypothetical protein F4778DRAFT_72062 [Xylariomycetidae sp. FL2044]|nr:hypothetical protein F4778DRAFT_72062 [Xylariomycetidae sp. FL2044]